MEVIMSAFDFDTMIAGFEFDFYGVDNCQFKLGISGSVFVLEAIENEDDGYRSYLGCIQISEPNGIFFSTPVAKVRVESFDERPGSGHADEGYRLVDVENGHVWLTFGTDNYDDWYPCFTFCYEPRKDQLVNPDQVM